MRSATLDTDEVYSDVLLLQEVLDVLSTHKERMECEEMCAEI